MEREQLGSGISRETLFDGHLTIFNLVDITRVTVDLWIEACHELMKMAIATNQPLFIIQDLSHPNVTQTPYSRTRGQELTEAYPDLRGFIAFVLPDAPDSQRIRLFVRRQNNRYRQREVFFAREDALAWIKAALHREQVVDIEDEND